MVDNFWASDNRNVDEMWMFGFVGREVAVDE